MNKPDEDPNEEGVYERLKRRLLAHIWTPGRLLQIGALAEELGVSSTPVREALTRLAAERLIVSTPNKGFFVKIPSEAGIHGLYYVNQVLLDAAVSRWPKKAEDRGANVIHETAASYLSQGRIAEQTVRLTAVLFTKIAQRCGIDEMAQIVCNLNDRLHHVRLVECVIIGDLPEELSKLIALYATRRRSELKTALRSYHERRSQQVASLCRELLLKSYSSGQHLLDRRS